MNNYKRIKYACYTTNVTMSVVGNLSPILFLTFRSLYGISYSLLGFLVLINFSTQLTVDLLCSFFSHKINMTSIVKKIPVIAAVGLVFYALTPFILPNNVYLGLVIGTVIFSAASGFAEVLISPVIAALPSDNPEREMSKLHSIYAWGVVAVIIVSTVYLLLFGSNNWHWLALLFSIIPLISAVLFLGSQLPELETPKKTSGVIALVKDKGLWLCFFAIFVGSILENTMSQWSSSYIEKALGIEKVWGDVFGVAMFAVMLGLGRSLYAKFGTNISKVLFLSGIGCLICYLTAAIVNVPIIGLIACALTGFTASMMWPGSLIIGAERFPTAGVFIYAMMASGGDFGAAVGPQLMGIITDTVANSRFGENLAAKLSLTPEQLGMKCGLLIGALFSVIAIIIFSYIMKRAKKPNLTENSQNSASENSAE